MAEQISKRIHIYPEFGTPLMQQGPKCCCSMLESRITASTTVWLKAGKAAAQRQQQRQETSSVGAVWFSGYGYLGVQLVPPARGLSRQ